MSIPAGRGLSNVANLPIMLYDGMKIGQISFQRLSSPVEVAYGDARIGSRYRGQTDPTASRYFADFDRTRIRR
jgi:dCTP deaminase